MSAPFSKEELEFRYSVIDAKISELLLSLDKSQFIVRFSKPFAFVGMVAMVLAIFMPGWLSVVGWGMVSVSLALTTSAHFKNKANDDKLSEVILLLDYLEEDLDERRDSL